MKLNKLLGYIQFLTVICIFLTGACRSRQEDAAFLKVMKIYDEAHQAQDTANYAQATTLYKRCIADCSAQKHAENDSIKKLLPKALVQLLNTYQSASMPGECIAFFDSLKTEVSLKPITPSNTILKQYYKRDIYVLLSYAMSRTDAEKEAADLMDVALKMPLSNPTPERKFRDYAYAAAVYYCVPTCQDKVLKYGRLALDEIQHCQQKSGAQWLVALMAKLYQGKGEVGKAIAMCREGFELAEVCNDTLGMANSKKELADYLYQWELYDEADKYISDAIGLMEKTHNSNPMVTTVAYTIKAKIAEKQGKHQNALTYIQKARQTSESLPYNSGGSDADLLMGTMLISHATPAHPEHITQGIQLLDKVSHEATFKLRARAFLELAKANINRGNDAAGRASLDSMYNILYTSNPPITLEGAFDYALDYYIKKGDAANIIRYTIALNSQKIGEKKAGMVKNVAKSLARFEVEKQEAEMIQKEKELEIRKIMEAVGIILGVIILGSFATFMGYKRKKMRQEHIKTEQELSHTQEVLAKTSEAKDKVEEELKKMEKSEVGKLKAGMSPQQLLDMRGDSKFKSYFNDAYPYFMTNVRKQSASNLTNKEELYCMLIALNCNNEDLADTFHVARTTVVMGKYRLRKKLNLADGVSMEEFLTETMRRGSFH